MNERKVVYLLLTANYVEGVYEHPRDAAMECYSRNRETADYYLKGGRLTSEEADAYADGDERYEGNSRLCFVQEWPFARVGEYRPWERARDLSPEEAREHRLA